MRHTATELTKANVQKLLGCLSPYLTSPFAIAFLQLDQLQMVIRAQRCSWQQGSQQQMELLTSTRRGNRC